MLIALAPEEFEEAGRVAEDVFVRQMRRLRGRLGLSQAELAERVVALGGNMYQQTIAKIESGQRAVRLSEADVIAKALETSVSDMLAVNVAEAVTGRGVLDLSVEELIAQAQAAERRRVVAAQAYTEADRQYALARDRLAGVQREEVHAQMARQRAAAHLQELTSERNFWAKKSIDRQVEMNREYGPRWKEMIGIEGEVPPPSGSGSDGTASDEAILQAQREVAEVLARSPLRIGSKLRARRLDVKVSVEDASHEANISSRIIQALEKDDFSVFTDTDDMGAKRLRHDWVKGNLRKYAEAISLDPEPLIKQYEAEMMGREE